MLPFFFRHYEPLVERFHVFDDGSTDRSRALLAARPDVELGTFSRTGDSFVLAALRFYREAWKASRGDADWVIVCNVDEHLYHPDLLGYLRRSREAGVTAIRAEGYEMVADRLPDHDGRLCDVVRTGVRWERMDKVGLFSPDAIEEIGYGAGRHRADPSGCVVYPDVAEVKLLHFKHLGAEYLVRRQLELRTRLLEGDVRNRYGNQYLRDPDVMRQNVDDLRRNAIRVI